MAVETGEAANHVDLLARLRRFITGRATVNTPEYVGTGSGTIGEIDTTPAAINETWTITCITEVLNGGIFSVVGSVSGPQANATVGTLYEGSEVIFRITDGAVDYDIGDQFEFDTTEGVMTSEGQEWELKRATADELMVMGKGLGGTDEIYVNFKLFENVGADIYNLVIQGAVGYINANVVDNQPGQSPKIGLSLWDDPMKYWFIANARRVIVVAKVSTFYVAGYFGLFLPYGTPEQYPYPMFIGANLANGGNNITGHYNTRNYSTNAMQNTNYWCPFCTTNNHFTAYPAQNDVTQSLIYWVDGSWQDFTQGLNGTGNPFDGNYYTASPNDTNIIQPLNSTFRRGNIDGTYELIPHTLTMSFPTIALAGELDGSFFVSGFSNGSENIITVGGDEYLVVQNVFRNGVADFAAIKLV